MQRSRITFLAEELESYLDYSFGRVSRTEPSRNIRKNSQGRWIRRKRIPGRWSDSSNAGIRIGRSVVGTVSRRARGDGFLGVRDDTSPGVSPSWTLSWATSVDTKRSFAPSRVLWRIVRQARAHTRSLSPPSPFERASSLYVYAREDFFIRVRSFRVHSQSVTSTPPPIS